MLTALKKYVDVFSIAITIQTITASSHALQVPCDLEKWSSTVSHQVNRHFRNEYKDDTRVFKVKPGKSKNIISRQIDGKKYQVNRKRHGLAHGMRQGFLAVDIANAFQEIPNHQFTNRAGNKFRNWIISKLDQDPLFLQKLELVSSFQRTGRESEAGFDDYPELYKEYERHDALNFETYAKKFVGPNSLFRDDYEVSVYKEALLHKTANEGTIDAKACRDLRYLRDLMQITHMLDLRRVPSFSPDMIKSVVSSIFFGQSSGLGQAENKFVENLWTRTGEYLNAT